MAGRAKKQESQKEGADAEEASASLAKTYAGLAYQSTKRLGVITRQQLLDAGISRRTIVRLVARRKLTRLHGGVYAFPGSADTRERKLMAAQLWYGPNAALSHYAAAHLWELQDIPHMFPIDVLREGRFKRPKHLGIKPHETDALPAEDVVEHKGYRVTTPLRTILDLARVLPPAKVEVAILDAIARGLFTAEQLVARCQQERRMRTRSAAKLTRAIRRAGFEVTTESPLEREVLQVLMDEGLKPEFGQVELWRLQPREFLGRYDLGWETLRVLVEVDSRKRHRALAERERDAEKDEQAAALGYALVRVRKENLRGEARVSFLNELREKLASGPARVALHPRRGELVPVGPGRKRRSRVRRPLGQLSLLGDERITN